MEYELNCLPQVPSKYRCKNADYNIRCSQYVYKSGLCWYHWKVKHKMIDPEPRREKWELIEIEEVA